MKLKSQNENDREMSLETGREEEEERQIIYHVGLTSFHETFQSIYMYIKKKKKEMNGEGIKK